MAKVDIEQDTEVNEGLKKKENSAEVTEVTDVPEISEVSTVATPTDEDNAGLPSLADNKAYPEFSCFFISKKNRIRRGCFNVAVAPSFDNFILGMILLNALSMAFVSYDLKCVDMDNVPTNKCTSNMIVGIFEYFFNLIFLFEMVVKIIGKGFYFGGSDTYLKDPWSYLDFVVVISSIVGTVMEIFETDFINLSVIRIFRVLRPLKSVSKLPKLKRLLEALAHSVDKLSNNVIILMFILILFSILGGQFFLGYGHARCRLTEFPVRFDSDYCVRNGLGDNPPEKGTVCWDTYITELVQSHQERPEDYICRDKSGSPIDKDDMLMTTRYISSSHATGTVKREIWEKPLDCFWPTDDEDESVCTMRKVDGGTGMHKCYPVPDVNGYTANTLQAKYTDDILMERWCGSNYDPFGQPRFNDDKFPYGFKGSRMILATYVGSLNWGYTTFDHFGAALLTIGQSVTQEGWVDIMYMYMDSYDAIVGLVVFFALILLGAFVILNLMLAVITKQIEETPEEGKLEVVVRKHGQVQKDKKDETKRKCFSLLGVDLNHSIFHVKQQIDAVSDEDIPVEQQRLMWYPAANRHGWNGPNEAEGGIVLVDSLPNPSGLIAAEPIEKTLASYGVPMNGPNAVIYLDIDQELISASTRRKNLGQKFDGTFRGKLIKVVESPNFTIFIWLCITLNTLVLALDQHPMDPNMEALFKLINYILSGIFLLEMMVKIGAFGFKEYCTDYYNRFDAIVVFFSLIEIILEVANAGGGGGLSALRAFRIFRVFKMAKDWEQLQKLLATMVESLKEIGNFFLLLCLFVYIYALVGMQFFANRFRFDGETGWPVKFSNDPKASSNNPRESEIAVCNFDSLLEAIVTIFQVLTGENWNTVMYDARRSVGPALAYFYFFTLVLLGVFMVMNIFLAILLSKFEGNDDLVAPQGDPETSGDGIGRKLMRAGTSSFVYFRDSVPSIRSKPRTAAITPIDQAAEAEVESQVEITEAPNANNGGKTKVHVYFVSGGTEEIQIDVNGDTKVFEVKEMCRQKILEVRQGEEFAVADVVKGMKLLSTKSIDDKRELEDDKTLYIEKVDIESGDDLFLEVEACGGVLFCFKRDGWLRKKMKSIYTNKKFDNGILILIVLSSICLALDNPFDRSGGLAQVLGYADWLFLVVFTGEMFVKVVYLGVICNGQLSYLHSGWNVLDLIIVVVGWVTALDIYDLAMLRALRTIRVLRPLRMISRRRELKLVMDALMSSLPSIFNVAVVCFLFMFIFAIVGVNMFKGKLDACQGDGFDDLSEEKQDLITTPKESWNKFSVNQMQLIEEEGCTEEKLNKLMRNRDRSPSYLTSQDLCICMLGSDSWDNVVNGLHFDNVLTAMATLYEISTTEGWVDVMYAAIDGVGPYMQPQRDYDRGAIIYFIIFMLFGAFFVMQLFVGVIIERFNAIREENIAEGKGQMVLATEDQKLLVRTIEFVHQMKMKKKIYPFTQWIYDKITYPTPDNAQFDAFIMFCILLNSLFMASTHLGMSEGFENFLRVANYVFAAIFFLEMCIKLLALGWKQYLADNWNCFDFAIVIGTTIGLIMEFSGRGDIGSAASVVRMFRIGRVLRLFNSWEELNNILKVIMSIGPALSNVAMILILLLMIYAVLGIQLFAYYELNDDLNEHAHYQNLGMSAATLFRYLTGENWNGMMHSMATRSDECIDSLHFRDKMQEKYGSKWETKLCTFNNGNKMHDCVPLQQCGDGPVLVFFYYTFTLLMTMVMLNLFIGIILDAFGETEDQVLTDAQLSEFVAMWTTFDEGATGKLSINQFKEFIQRLPEPMGFGKDYEASNDELEKAIIDLGMSLMVEEIEEVENESKGNEPDYGAIRLNSYDIAIALAKRVSKNMAKLSFSSEGDIGIRIDVDSRWRGTIVDFDDEKGHLVKPDGVENESFYEYVKAKGNSARSCVIYGRKIVDHTPGQAVEFIGPPPGDQRSEGNIGKGINKGMIGRIASVAPPPQGLSNSSFIATVEFLNGVSAAVEMEKLALSPFVKTPAKEDEFNEVYHEKTGKKGILTLFKTAESGLCTVEFADGEEAQYRADELLTAEDKCFKDVSQQHINILKVDSYRNATPIFKKFFEAERRKLLAPKVKSEEAGTVEDISETSPSDDTA